MLNGPELADNPSLLYAYTAILLSIVVDIHKVTNIIRFFIFLSSKLCLIVYAGVSLSTHVISVVYLASLIFSDLPGTLKEILLPPVSALPNELTQVPIP